MKLSDFDYVLPQELIAYHPVPDRVSSRLLVLDRTDGTVRHKHFRDLSEYIQ
ncbi:MAG: S-adenosylmethionine:tRNA ribosyltransferase-isomerase, partial [Candidatus Omnitrophica bacterium]|nr:S-adenosylmethionine:tRNA ribosyltransferase-isomerase [Candidatus Omnitrophota bacterium]